jgi:hypothetical protein
MRTYESYQKENTLLLQRIEKYKQYIECQRNIIRSIKSASQKKKKRSKDRRDPQVNMEEAQRAAEEKAEQLRIQAEKALKQQA